MRYLERELRGVGIVIRSVTFKASPKKVHVGGMDARPHVLRVPEKKKKKNSLRKTAEALRCKLGRPPLFLDYKLTRRNYTAS